MPKFKAFRGEFRFLEKNNSGIEVYRKLLIGLRSELWEKETFDIIYKHRDRNKAFLDIGAWIGPMSMYASQFYKEVVAIEADNIAIKCFKKNTEHLDNILLIEKAFSQQSSKWMYFGTNKNRINTNNVLGNSMSQARESQIYDQDYRVSTVSIKNILELNKEFALIKCDIEGGEESVIPELFISCQLNNTNLWMSFHLKWWENRDINRFRSYFEMAEQILYFKDIIWLELKSNDTLLMLLEQDPVASILFVFGNKIQVQYSLK